MRRITVLLCTLLSLSAIAQQNLSGSRQSGFYTYIYRINGEEARQLYQSGMDKLGEEYLHTKVDSFAADTEEIPSLPPGNYLLVQADGSRLEMRLKTIDNLQVKLLNNNRDLIIVLHDRSGALIPDAKVFTGRRQIPYDPHIQAFRLGKKRKARHVKIAHQGTFHYLTVGNRQQRYFWRKLSNSFPLRYVVQPIRRLVHGYPRYNQRGNYYYGTAHEKKFTGFMTFSKPRYKPGDTVKLKAWVTTRKGKPVNRPLLLRLSDQKLETDTILATLTPYRPGGYTYSFVLKDSLDLTLDQQQLLTLEEQRSRRYDLDAYEGDLSDEEYAAKRPVLMRGKFELEEYELGTVTFKARSDKKEHYRHSPVAIYCKATDENDLTIMDGRVEILVKPVNYAIGRFYAPQVFLPDTLWYHTQPLENIGETKIILPDSLFPAASFTYEVVCTFLNSNNEQKTDRLQHHFSNDRRQLLFDQQQDSLHISLSEAGQSIPAAALLYTFSREKDTIRQQPVQLPFSLRIDPFVMHYEVRSDSLRKTYKTGQAASSLLACRSLRTHDSILIAVTNPRRLSFWYTIFANQKIIKRGYGDSLFFADRVRTKKNYFVSLQYIYANQSRHENYTIPFKDKALSIQVHQPQQVYPGQQVNVDIAVKDAEGKPVADADVTAYAFTKKFPDVHPPAIPYLGKRYRPRKGYNQFHLQGPLDSSSRSLYWWRKSQEMGLDTIEYYRFLHPATQYVNTEAAPHGTTQLAPFVVLYGELQPVHLLYIDELPYFFSQAGHLQQYSFPVKPGKHALRIRTNNRLIHVDNVWAAEGKKTFLSINADAADHNIRIQKMPDTLTNAEKVLWSKYMLLIENNFGEKLATIEQQDRLTVLNLLQAPRLGSNYTYADALSGRLRQQRNYLLTGPLTPDTAWLHVKERFTQDFQPEGSYAYTITQGLIKQKQLPYSQYPFGSWLTYQAPPARFKDYVLSATDIDSLWQEYLDHRNATEDLFRNQTLNKGSNGQLRIGDPLDAAGKKLFVTSIILFRYDDPDFARIYKGITRDMGYVQPGMYRLVLLFSGDQYFIRDSIRIQKDGINYYDIGVILPREKDSTSGRISSILNNRESAWRSYYQSEDLDAIKTTFHNKYLDLSKYSKLIYGRVTEQKTGEPLAGVTILVKGTNVATMTNSQGYFEMQVPERGAIVAQFVGYVTITRRITEESSYDMELLAQESRLEEVVVVGYGVRRKSSMVGSIASVEPAEQLLTGKLAGVMIRGNATVQDGLAPLVLMDGVPYAGDWSTMDKSLLASVNVLKSAEATAIYGARAAGGVIVITTKAQAEAAKAAAIEDAAPTPGNTLRRNFRDDAWWQPALRTDRQGKASFSVTYPDDITNWRTFVVAMGNQKRTGFVENEVRSFKAVSGAITLPQFAVAGDSMQVIGKTMNYGMDTIRVNRVFRMNDNIVDSTLLSLTNARIDSFMVAVPQQDSLRLQYTIRKTDGYFDGEERSIPVFKQGVEETKGLFAVLEKDTSFTLQPDAGLGSLTIRAETAVWPVLLDEIEYLHHYEYWCNEQMASKLKALLLKKKVYSYLKKPFKEDRAIRELVSKLYQGKSQGLLWGWWNNNAPVLWISQHVTEALLMAEQQGFPINLNKQQLIDYLVYNFTGYGTAEKISAVHLLQGLSSKVDYRPYIDTLEKRVANKTLYEKLQVLHLKQNAGLPVALDTFIAKQQRTLMGNIYWGEESYAFFNNSIGNTLAMYRVLEKAGGHDHLLKKVLYYFLEKRKDGKWRNTYESSRILETILPGLLKEQAGSPVASFTIAGPQTTEVNTFPYTATFSGSEKLTITKPAGKLVYFTAWQKSWNPQPKKVEGDFVVQSFFERNGQPRADLKAGETVTLKVKVQVKADADYVMVEVPIPAGCSYSNKSQSWSNNEVHREYFKNKVGIFCSSLAKGEYVFTVFLLPRYSGSYHLNPAKAEMMYFPVFYGREAMKKVRID